MIITILGSLLFIAIVIGISAVYISYANLDHRFPDKRPGFWSLLFNSIVLGIVTVASMGALAQEDTEVSSNLAMMVLGLLAAPAIAPPYYIDDITHPNRIERWLEGIKSRITAFFAIKVVALVIALITSIFFSWYWILALICCLALMAKSGALMSSDSRLQGYSEDVIPPRIMKKWMFRSGSSILSFAVLWSASPYIILSETTAEPSSWFGFAGVGLGVFITGFRD